MHFGARFYLPYLNPSLDTSQSKMMKTKVVEAVEGAKVEIRRRGRLRN
jgi:hypothetical protein